MGSIIVGLLAVASVLGGDLEAETGVLLEVNILWALLPLGTLGDLILEDLVITDTSLPAV